MSLPEGKRSLGGSRSEPALLWVRHCGLGENLPLFLARQRHAREANTPITLVSFSAGYRWNETSVLRAKFLKTRTLAKRTRIHFDASFTGAELAEPPSQRRPSASGLPRSSSDVFAFPRGLCSVGKACHTLRRTHGFAALLLRAVSGLQLPKSSERSCVPAPHGAP